MYSGKKSNIPFRFATSSIVPIPISASDAAPMNEAVTGNCSLAEEVIDGNIEGFGDDRKVAQTYAALVVLDVGNGRDVVETEDFSQFSLTHFVQFAILANVTTDELFVKFHAIFSFLFACCIYYIPSIIYSQVKTDDFDANLLTGFAKLHEGFFVHRKFAIYFCVTFRRGICDNDVRQGGR